MIRSILLHLDLLPASSTRLLAALDLGRRFDAGVTAAFGFAEAAPPAAYAYSAQAASPGVEAEFAAARREQARRDLRRHLGADAPPTLWLDLPGAELARRFVDEAAYADLLVLGAPATALGGPAHGFVEDVLLGSGKPALVLPAAARPATIGRRILIAWNGSPQASRALVAALPFLRDADAVDVVGWAPAPLAASASGVDVGAYLRRHGVEATVRGLPHARDVAAAVAVQARERDADLLVMGCYGHGRWRERVLGGATRALLSAPPLPILLAH